MMGVWSPQDLWRGRSVEGKVRKLGESFCVRLMLSVSVFRGLRTGKVYDVESCKGLLSFCHWMVSVLCVVSIFPSLVCERLAFPQCICLGPLL